MRLKQKWCVSCGLVQSREAKRCCYCNSSLKNIIEIYSPRTHQSRYEEV